MPNRLRIRLNQLALLLKGQDPRSKPYELVENYAFANVDPKAELSNSGTELERLFWSHDGRLTNKWPHYLPIHERHLAPFKTGFPDGKGGTRPLRLLELGVSHGGSLQLWRKFLGPQAIIFGIDIDPLCRPLDTPDLPVRIGSQGDPKFLKAVVAEMGGLDVVIDDGSHIAVHQRASFDALFPQLTEGGLYIIEDTQTSYWRLWDGGYRRPGTAIELAKSVVDDMHGWYHDSPLDRPAAKSQIGAVSFHDGIIVFEKRHRTPPVHTKMGTPSL